jgi:hypothetical protein
VIIGGQASAVPSAFPQTVDTAQLLASWNAKLPALKSALARGESATAALKEAGLPAITGRPISESQVAGGVQPDSGPSCQDWTCGWQFDAMSSFQIAWLVWVGAISGPAAVCFFLGTGTAGLACTVAGAIWGVISAYTYFPPSYNAHRCLYAGIGFGSEAKWEYC